MKEGGVNFFTYSLLYITLNSDRRKRKNHLRETHFYYLHIKLKSRDTNFVTSLKTLIFYTEKLNKTYGSNGI